MNLSSVAGPILGGVVYDHGAYYAVFGIAFGVLGVDVVLRVLLIEKTEAVKWTSPDPAKDSMSNAAALEVNLITDGSNIEGDQTARDRRYWWQRLPTTIQLLASRRILITILGSFVMALLLAAFETVSPLYVETKFHFSATGAGLIFLFDPLVGHDCDKHPQLGRYVAVAGFLGAAPPLVLLRLVRREGISQIVHLCALLALIENCTPTYD